MSCGIASKETKAADDAAAIRHQIVKAAIRLLHRDQEETVPCPICEASYDRQKLESALQSIAKQPPDDVAARLNSLEAQLERAEDFERQAQMFSDELVETEQRANSIRGEIDAGDTKELSEPVSSDNLDAMIKQHRERENSIEAQIESQEDWFGKIESQIDKLREEGDSTISKLSLKRAVNPKTALRLSKGSIKTSSHSVNQSGGYDRRSIPV